VSFVGRSTSVVLKCFYKTSLQFLCSYNVTISNLAFDQCGGHNQWLQINCGQCQIYYGSVVKSIYSPSLLVACCSFTAISNITIQNPVQYAIIGYNILGESLINFISVHTTTEESMGMMLYFEDDRYAREYSNQRNTIFIINVLVGIPRYRSLVHSYRSIGNVFVMNVMQKEYNITITISNSIFSDNKGPVVKITGNKDISFLNNILIIDCSFSHNKQYFVGSMVDVRINPLHTTVALLNCTFSMNEYTEPLLSIKGEYYPTNECPLMRGGVSLINVTFYVNEYCGLIYCYGYDLSKPCVMQVFLKEIAIVGTTKSNILIFAKSTAIHFSGNVLFNNNFAKTIITFDSSLVTFNANITFLQNACSKIITLISQHPYIKIMEYSSIVFESNKYTTLISVETDKTLYPYCLFQYVTLCVGRSKEFQGIHI